MRIVFVICWCLLITIFSGCFCRVDCLGDGSFVKITVAQDGQNAIFGDSAFIVQDSIQLFNASNQQSEYINFNESNQSLDVLLLNGVSYNLILGQDYDFQLELSTEIIGRNSCCNEYEVVEFRVDGQDICAFSCDNILIELD